MEPKVLKVAFPLKFLRQDSKILDPDDTEYIHQFYLLENLALGLVQDSSKSPTGYEPGLARSWEQISPTRWDFLLKDDLRWSDGKTIAPQAIVDHIEKLRDGSHRHVVYLKKLKKAGVAGNKLTLEFDSPVNEGLIHELSLADASLLHPGNRDGDWRTVSGPYSVETYEVGKRLVLRRNPHFSNGIDYPASVELAPYSEESFDQFFKSLDVDLVRVGRPADKKAYGDAISRAPQRLWGYPTLIHFFQFNPKSDLWRDKASRRALAALVDEALESVAFDGLTRERQFIPKGYMGRLDTPPRFKNSDAKTISGREFSVNFHSSYETYRPILDALKRRFKKAGVDARFEFTRFSSEDTGTADVNYWLFAGNQKDALGSWKFLFSEDRGAFGSFLPKTKGLLDAVAVAKGAKQREEALRKLHRKVLEEAYGVPLFVEPVLFLASDRVDLSRLNRFDMRMRFYELGWK